MYEIKILDLDNSLKNGPIVFNTLEDANSWLDKHLAKESPFGWGLKDRWINGNSLIEEKKLEATDSRIRIDEAFGEITEYFFPKNYVVEIRDLSLDLDYLEEQAIQNRIKEYPTLDKILDILMDKGTNSQEWVEMMAYRQSVKNKYQKPVR